MMQIEIKENEFHPYYKGYVEKAKYDNIVKGLETCKIEALEKIEQIHANKWTYAYADGKWTLVEVLQHIIDTELIFSYRALRFSRNDSTPIEGFEQDDYVPYSNANQYDKQQILASFEAVRNTSIALFKGFTPEMLVRSGVASGSLMSVRAIGYILQGHQNHHFKIIEERYLN